jgi:hypothetical protein
MKMIARSWPRFVVALTVLGASIAGAQTLSGRWDASVNIQGTVIPFRLDISEDGKALTGILYNGNEPETTTSAELQNGSVILRFDHYLTTISATPRDGKLVGTLDGRFEVEKYISSYPFEAKPYTAPVAASVSAPSIAGDWIVPYNSAKGEKAWRFIVQQTGPDVSASILRVDGDTGALTGAYRNGRFELSHFDGSRPLVASVESQADGTLAIQLSGPFSPKDKLIAYRPEVARAKGLPEPSNYATHTTVRDPNEVFAFSFTGNITTAGLRSWRWILKNPSSKTLFPESAPL